MRALLLALALAQAGADLATAAEALAAVQRRAAALPAGEAIAELRAAARVPVPAGSEGDQLRGDVYAELSRRLLGGGDAAGALEAARAGLAAVAAAPSPVRALLRLREAEALEALGREVEAVDVYEDTIAIARALLAKEEP